jgi:hypothetical protein
MKTHYFSHLVLIGAFAAAGAAYGQQPPDSVTSDSMANTAMGTDALLNLNLDEAGCHNTAAGEDALYSDTNGSYNTATGFSSLYSNTSGNNNTAAGYESLYSNSTGSNNTANGYQALYSATTGNYNTASGAEALYRNSAGVQNSAYGSYALYANGRGNYNTAAGSYALYSSTTGSSNVAVGFKAGYYLTTGSNNVDIGSPGAAGDSAVIRIGTVSSTGQSTQTAIYLAGANAAITGATAQLSVNSLTGQVGIAGSSERFKTDIAPMGSTTSKLDQLQPVTFRYKSEPRSPRQYGLIAEEVAKVYPELIVRDAKGLILSVRYDELAPMLLNEVKQQKQELAEQAMQIHRLEAAVFSGGSSAAVNH